MQVIDYNSSSYTKDFAHSLRDTGFAVLKNFPISQEDIAAVYSVWANFFNLPLADKMAYEFSLETQDGYVATSLSETAKGNDVKDLKEFYHYYFNKRCPKLQHEVTDKIFIQMLTFATELLSAIEQHCPEEVQSTFTMPLSDMVINSEYNLLRLINYPALDGSEDLGAVRAAAHADINLITLLPAASERGLQLLTKENKWVDVPYNKDYLVVNIGDMLQECTGGFYKSTMHRVINPDGMDSSRARMSMPLFVHPRSDVRLSKRYLAGEYLQQRLRELGLAK